MVGARIETVRGRVREHVGAQVGRAGRPGCGQCGCSDAGRVSPPGTVGA